MKTFDATPPADYPEQVIVANDTEFTARHPEAEVRNRTPHTLPLQGNRGIV